MRKPGSPSQQPDSEPAALTRHAPKGSLLKGSYGFLNIYFADSFADVTPNYEFNLQLTRNHGGVSLRHTKLGLPFATPRESAGVLPRITPHWGFCLQLRVYLSTGALPHVTPNCGFLLQSRLNARAASDAQTQDQDTKEWTLAEH